VKDGIFVDWQTSRELAPLINRQKSYGCTNADSWRSVPFARMPNVSLEPGAQDTSLDELVAGVEKGILIYGDGSWSIDQQRYNFQFGGKRSGRSARARSRDAARRRLPVTFNRLLGRL
jgi:TldD protein